MRNVGQTANAQQTGIAEESLTTNKLKNPIKITISGDASGSIQFDGSQDVTINTTVNNSAKLGNLDPSAYEQIANKGQPNGYVELDSTGKIPFDKIPTTFQSDIDMNYNQIHNLGDPVNSGDVATKNYIDSKVQGLTWQKSVISNTLVDPPSSPATGDRYIVPASATGDWSGHTDDIAEFDGSAWNFTTPANGTAVWVEDESSNYEFNGSEWIKFGSTVNHNNTLGLQGGNSTERYHLSAAQYNEVVNSTDSNTPNTLVKRDQNGNFSATTINANLNGNASSADKWSSQRTLTITGDVSGSTVIDGTADASISATIINKDTQNSANTLVERDANGNFSANVITANLSGSATSATKLSTPRNISLSGDVTGSAAFDGSSDTTISTTISNKDSANTPNTLVQRDANGNFSAGTITASLNGTASNADKLDNLDSTQFLRSDTGELTFTISNNTGNGGQYTIKTLGAISDAKSGLILFAKAYDGSTNLEKEGFEGKIYINRGSSSAYNISKSYDLICTTAYQQTRLSLKGNSSDEYLVTTTYNNETWYGLYSPSDSERTITVKGMLWSDPIFIPDATNYTVTKVNGNELYVDQYKVWHAGNDGAGSGLDADLLEGAQPDTSATANTIAKRDSSGNLTANIFNGSLNGNANTASKWQNTRTVSLTGDVTGSTNLDGSSNVSIATSIPNKDSANTPNTLVQRDANGDFSAGTITATLNGNITGNAPTADKWSTARTVSLQGDVTGSTSIDGSNDTTITTTIPNKDSANTPNTLVVRNSSGDFSAGTITATLNGNATSADKWSTARTFTISGDITGSTSIDGSGDVSLTATIANKDSANTPNTLVQRDANGNFSAGTITATLNGNATSADKWSTARTFTISGDITGSTSIDGSGDISLTATITNKDSANTPNTLVQRDANGNFSAGTITASLNGNATSADKWSTARTITLNGDVNGSATLDGSQDITISTTAKSTPTILLMGDDTVVSTTNTTSTDVKTIRFTTMGNQINTVDLYLSAWNATSSATTTVIATINNSTSQSATTTSASETMLEITGLPVNAYPAINTLTISIQTSDANYAAYQQLTEIVGK